MARIQPTAESDGAPPDLAEAAEAAEAPATACAQVHEAQPTTALAPSRRLVLKGHTYGVSCLAALDRNRLASGSDDKSIIIWNLAETRPRVRARSATWPTPSGSPSSNTRADGSQLAKLEGHTEFVSSLVTLDGDRLVSVSADKSIIIWNLATGTQLAKLEGHNSMIFCVAALKGGRLASGSENGRIRLWNLADGKLLAKLEGHTAGVLCLAELAGDRLASGGSFGRIIIWNLADFSQLASLEGHRDFVRCLVALDGGLLCGNQNFTARSC